MAGQKPSAAHTAVATDFPRSARRTWLVAAAVAIMLACYFTLSQSAALTKGAAFDEPIHLTGGDAYWNFGDFRLQPENGNLPQRWAALPLYLANAGFPELGPDEWRMPSTQAMGDAFFFGPGRHASSLLMRGRAMIGLFGVALGLVIFLATQRLLGTGPALVSLALFSCCPSVLAHGALITSDMAVTLFFTAAVLCVWRVLQVVNWQTLIGGSIVTGCLLVSKLSGVLILPMSVVLLAVRLFSREPTLVTFGRKSWIIERRRLRLPLYLAMAVTQAILAIAIIWGFYNFRYSMFATHSESDRARNVVAENAPEIPWNLYLDASRPLDRAISTMREMRLLPEGYLFGFAAMLHEAKSRPAFLNGEYRMHGWWEFFPYCVLVKTPLTLFALLALAMAWNIHNWRLSGSERAQRTAAMSRSLYRSAPLLTLFVVYWLFAISSHLNIGHRHILPTYPPMLVFAGCAWMWVTERRNAQAETRRSGASDKRGASSVTTWLRSRRHPILAAAVVASLVSFGTESLLNWPNYLAYVNQLPGNHSNAYRHLVDSSLDWGQDLPALKNWLAEAGLIGSTQGSYLAYFGGDNPAYYGIRAQQLPGFWDRTSAGIPEPLTPGTYCVSATLVQNMYSRFPGRWNQEYEATYQQLAGKVQRFRALGPEERKALLAGKDGAAWLNMFQSYEHARFARLTSFLRQREPQTEINYSILIYQLARDDIQRAVNGPPVELRNFPDFRGP